MMYQLMVKETIKQNYNKSQKSTIRKKMMMVRLFLLKDMNNTAMKRKAYSMVMTKKMIDNKSMKKSFSVNNNKRMMIKKRSQIQIK